jgi:hypothetical protein
MRFFPTVQRVQFRPGKVEVNIASNWDITQILQDTLVGMKHHIETSANEQQQAPGNKGNKGLKAQVKQQQVKQQPKRQDRNQGSST